MDVGRSHDGAAGIVRQHVDVVRLAQGADFHRLREATHVRKVNAGVPAPRILLISKYRYQYRKTGKSQPTILISKYRYRYRKM